MQGNSCENKNHFHTLNLGLQARADVQVSIKREEVTHLRGVPWVFV
ncbi:hypothetical protein acsn021_16410 [Anaerocolumna cellulosilytica]|uniref:Uncharacterized protein n=1 Tax=Anaerocolumna cellulosilytica TaxID=433286 RepID=A0A6S6R3J7_9FIRM|nr:hypothetical protein acsn021_16410 [Anaerocolumna cellulosilytica]